MTRTTRAGVLLLALPLSTILAGCGGGGEDTADRRALEREAMERDLDLALQPDSAPLQPELADVPLAE
ncbi:MAG TPA: hypothetical protein VFX98_08025, partial [Longimicrobiaceae bacterium]|nr:hypothetical protein [Longimicrobiaceae bacterium]